MEKSHKKLTVSKKIGLILAHFIGFIWLTYAILLFIDFYYFLYLGLIIFYALLRAVTFSHGSNIL